MVQRVRYFLKAAEKGSFSLAAQELYISPQALTKQIGVLEQELGGPLFSRSPRGVSLTALGAFAFQKLGRAARDFDAAVTEVRDFAANSREQLHIGIFSALPRENLVLPLVSYLLASFPDRQFVLEMLELGEGLTKFYEGKLDFLLTNLHQEDRMEGYELLSFGVYEAKVVVSLLHPWVMKEQITAEDLRGETFIKMQMDPGAYSVPWEDSFYRNIPCRDILEVRNFETMMVTLRQGKGFAVFPLAFMNMDQAQIRSFDYPGTPLRFYTALLYDPSNARGGLEEIVRGIREEFSLE